MVQNEITFENLPKAVAPKRIPIGIDDACKLIGKVIKA